MLIVFKSNSNWNEGMDDGLFPTWNYRCNYLSISYSHIISVGKMGPWTKERERITLKNISVWNKPSRFWQNWSLIFFYAILSKTTWTGSDFIYFSGASWQVFTDNVNKNKTSLNKFKTNNLWYWFYAIFSLYSLIHCGLVMPFGVSHLGQHWLT